MTENLLPKLRPVDPHLIIHAGKPSILLRDPLQLTDRVVVIPQQLAPLLSLCDGTRDIGALNAAFSVRHGMRLGSGVLEQFVEVLDEALLLDNDRSAQARKHALTKYRQAPYRPPASAGRSYPQDADEARALLDSYLDAVEDTETGLADVRGLICPHIDYARGGPVYAATWKRAAEAARSADLVVLLGTDHYGSALLTLTHQSYQTPFGILPTAREIVDALAQAIEPDDAFGSELFHRCEHSVELAAVWLHHVREGEACEMVPILCSAFGQFMRQGVDPGQEPVFDKLADALWQAAAGRRVLIVAAADLAHVGPAFGGPPQGVMEQAKLQAIDGELVEQMCAGDAGALFASIEREHDRYNVCGLPPIYTALRLLGPIQGERVAYERCPADQAGTSLVSICGVLLGHAQNYPPPHSD